MSQRITAVFTVEDGQVQAARVESSEDTAGGMTLTDRHQLVPKVEHAIPVLRRLLRLARIATGGRR